MGPRRPELGGPGALALFFYPIVVVVYISMPKEMMTSLADASQGLERAWGEDSRMTRNHGTCCLQPGRPTCFEAGGFGAEGLLQFDGGCWRI